MLALFFFAGNAFAQIQVELKLPRLQYIAYEPVVANLTITNLAGRDVDLRDSNGQAWFGFEINGNENQSIAPLSKASTEPLNVAAGKRVTRKINLTPLFGVHDFGTYRVRAHIYFADLSKFFYSETKVFEITDARPIWQKTVGVPQGEDASGSARTYSLMTNRFPDHDLEREGAGVRPRTTTHDLARPRQRFCAGKECVLRPRTVAPPMLTVIPSAPSASRRANGNFSTDCRRLSPRSNVSHMRE